MADKYYPQDAIGNQIKVGDVVHVNLPNPYLLMKVVELNPALGLNGGEMVTPGRIILQGGLPVNFAPGEPLTALCVLKTPDQIVIADSMPTLVKPS
jgi:hypothetical protein